MRIIAIVAAAALLCGTTFSQVGSGSYTDGVGGTVNITVTDTAGPGVSVTFQDQTGFTPATPGTTGSNSTAENTTCQNAGGNDGVQTNSPDPSTFRIKNGKAQVKKNGKWVNLRLKKKKCLQRPPRLEAAYVGPENVGSLPPEPL